MTDPGRGISQAACLGVLQERRTGPPDGETPAQRETLTMETTRQTARSRALGGVAGVFGLVTLAAAGNVLFGPAAVQNLAGDIVPFVVWFNFCAGFAYLAAAIGLWTARPWGHRLAKVIAVATLVAGLGFALVALAGEPVEPRTGAALALRTAVWALLARLSVPRKGS